MRLARPPFFSSDPLRTQRLCVRLTSTFSARRLNSRESSRSIPASTRNSPLFNRIRKKSAPTNRHSSARSRSLFAPFFTPAEISPACPELVEGRVKNDPLFLAVFTHNLLKLAQLTHSFSIAPFHFFAVFFTLVEISPVFATLGKKWWGTPSASLPNRNYISGFTEPKRLTPSHLVNVSSFSACSFKARRVTEL
jgi:hypothetical protein